MLLEIETLKNVLTAEFILPKKQTLLMFYRCNDLFQSIMQIKDDKVLFTAIAKVV
jgi:hypothetical protein